MFALGMVSGILLPGSMGAICKQSTLYHLKHTNLFQCFPSLTVAVFCSLIDANPISGKIPDFIGNWTQIARL